jgi:hypothetical protein
MGGNDKNLLFMTITQSSNYTHLNNTNTNINTSTTIITTTNNNNNNNNNKGDWNPFKITQTVPEQHTRKAQN